MIDANLLLAEGLTLRGVTTKYTDEIKLPKGYDEFGNALQQDPNNAGKQLFLNITVDVAFTGEATTATVTPKLYGGSATAPTGLLLTGPQHRAGAAYLKAGTLIWSCALPAGLTAVQFLRVGFTVGTTALTAGAVNAWIGLEPFQAK